MFPVFKKVSVGVLSAAAALGLFASSAAASGEFMITGGLTSQPIGHYEFCKRESAECNIRNKSMAPLKLNQQVWNKIVQVNLTVNNRIQPMTDMEIFGQEEYWAYPTNVGDCEDYVLFKQRELAKAGVSLSHMLITVVRKPDGEGHAVLTLRTDRGDFILDNLTDEILNWQATDYTYLKRQSDQNSGQWVSIEAPSNLVVGSVRR
ncbi:putative transglutaminase-like cysteine proteinase [Paenochrobactrum gallinarii]|uniref:Putative transglutaminase-like cysteine proteinase n=1 Tax=Paenochrobactrum gallinarii TaxID=643673 RepID=A0A841M3K0_9HYPH|nr:putative transglutaminase-like cysteine proteinase [Paenochrobactrum gallinarii]